MGTKLFLKSFSTYCFTRYFETIKGVVLSFVKFQVLNESSNTTYWLMFCLPIHQKITMEILHTWNSHGSTVNNYDVIANFLHISLNLT